MVAAASPRVRMVALGVALAGLLAAPASWSAQTLGHATNGTFPAGGPASAGFGGGGMGGPPGGGNRTFAPPNGGTRAPHRAQAGRHVRRQLRRAHRRPRLRQGPRRRHHRRLEPDGRGRRRSSSRAPTSPASAASPAASPRSAWPGSSRRSPRASIRWVLVDGNTGMGPQDGRTGATTVMDWVQANGKKVTSSGLYDSAPLRNLTGFLVILERHGQRQRQRTPHRVLVVDDEPNIVDVDRDGPEVPGLHGRVGGDRAGGARAGRGVQARPDRARRDAARHGGLRRRQAARRRSAPASRSSSSPRATPRTTRSAASRSAATTT